MTEAEFDRRLALIQSREFGAGLLGTVVYASLLIGLVAVDLAGMVFQALRI